MFKQKMFLRVYFLRFVIDKYKNYFIIYFFK